MVIYLYCMRYHICYTHAICTNTCIAHKICNTLQLFADMIPTLCNGDRDIFRGKQVIARHEVRYPMTPYPCNARYILCAPLFYNRKTLFLTESISDVLYLLCFLNQQLHLLSVSAAGVLSLFLCETVTFEKTHN